MAILRPILNLPFNCAEVSQSNYFPSYNLKGTRFSLLSCYQLMFIAVVAKTLSISYRMCDHRDNNKTILHIYGSRQMFYFTICLSMVNPKDLFLS